MRVHFIAIGGSIMHSLAIALKLNGHEVSGSDDQIFDPARSKLALHDLLPEPGWDAEKINNDLDAVILGMHAFSDNPELKKAHDLDIPVYSFPEFVARQSTHKQRIVVAGSAGKTSITSMIMHVLQKAGKDFDYLVGAQIPGFENPVKLSEDTPVIVIEGDEYLSSKIDKKPKFLHYQPHILVISNISWDHINVFPEEEIYVKQFEQLLTELEKAASVIYFEEDQRLKELVEKHTDEEIHYLYPYQLPSFRIEAEGFFLKVGEEEAKMKVMGAHNMGNIEAAWKVCQLLSIEAADFVKHMSSFEGAGIRLEKIREDENGLLIRDYAHAPSKVRASVEAVRSMYPDRNLIACLELHTFSSLNKDFIPKYEGSLQMADEKLVFVDPDALKKRRMENLDGEFIRASFGEDALLFAEKAEEIKNFVAKRKKGKDVILMMSSGNFGGLNLEGLI